MGSFMKSSKVKQIIPTLKKTPVTSAPFVEVESNVTLNEDQARDVARRVSRGRGSTIRTSFRGVLTKGNSLSPQRKNLLGE